MALFVRIRITSGCDFIHNIIASNSMEQEALSASNSMEQEALSASNSMEQEALSASNSMEQEALSDRKSTRLNSSHVRTARMPSSAW